MDALRRCVDIEGRTRRRDYWHFILAHTVISVALVLTGDHFLTTNYPYLVYSTLMLVPAISIAVRRLHDTGRSGWWMLIGLIPIVGSIVLFVFFIMCGETETNRWGTNPKLDFTVGG